jgi:hypothetical protein
MKEWLVTDLSPQCQDNEGLTDLERQFELGHERAYMMN